MQQTLLDEDARCNAYLPPTTRLVVLNTVREVFLATHFQSIVTKDGSGLVVMFNGVFGDRAAQSAGASSAGSVGDGDIVVSSQDRVGLGAGAGRRHLRARSSFPRCSFPVEDERVLCVTGWP